MQLYIHIPFCKSKCRYCDFNSYACQSDATVFSYLTALNRELKYAGKKFCNAKIDTVYIGGGTPSLLGAKQIQGICKTVFDNFDLSNLKEFSIECNPESIDADKLVAYRESGINRISIGVQSLDDRNLRSVGRLHDAKTAIDAISLAKKHFDNVSCDVIVGLPYDTEESVERTVSTLADLVEHISVYELTLEENTPLAKRIKDGLTILPSDDEVASLFEVALAVLKSKGFARYEVSNFAKPDRYSRHNFGYWTREEYIGIGAGAHSLIKTKDGVERLANEIRFASPKNINAYIAGINCVSEFDDVPRTDMNVLSDLDIRNEEIMLGLRTNLGVRKTLIENKITPTLKKFFIEKGDRISLTDEGLAVMNGILVKLMDFD